MDVHTRDPYLLTELLRTSTADVVVGLRDFLERQHFVLEATALAAAHLDARGHHFIVVNAERGEHQVVTPDGVAIARWQSLSKNTKAEYAASLVRARAVARGPRQPPAGVPIELQLPGRADVIVLRWTGRGHERRASFWFGDRVFTIDGTVHHRRNERTDESSFALVADVPADVLLDALPASPVRLDPDLEVTGLARLQALATPPANGARFVLHVGSTLAGAIYNSSVHASTSVQIAFDLASRSATFRQSSVLDDS